MATREVKSVPELAVLASRRLPMPGVSGLQTQCVRYSQLEQNTIGGWEGTRAHLGPESSALVAMRINIVEAPAEFTWPIRLGRCFRPGFKICLEIVHSTALDLPVELQAHLLSQEESEQLLAWTPPATITAAPAKGAHHGSSASLCGTVTRSTIVEAGKLITWPSGTSHKRPLPSESQRAYPQASADQPQPGPDARQAQPPQQPPQAPAVMPPVPGLLSQAGPVQQLPQVGQADSSMGVAGDARTSQQGEGRGPPGQAVGGPPAGNMVTREEFVFGDLRFAKPSRMSPVYIAFTCTVPGTEDKLIVMYTQPTVCTCRAEQWSPACARLGMPDMAATSLEPASTQVHDAPMAPPQPPLPQQQQQQQVHGQGSWQAISRAQPSATQGSTVSTAGRVPAALVQHPFGHAQLTGPTTSTAPPTTAEASTGPPLVQRLSRPQGTAVSLSARLLQQAQGGPSPTVHDVMEWCGESFAALGLARPLAQEDLQALAVMSGVTDPPAPLAPTTLESFLAHYQAFLAFMRHIPALWNQQSPCVVAGFAVTRDVAGQRLASEPMGTFICRLDASSMSGGMALAVKVAEGHPLAGQDGVLHCLLTKADVEFNRPIQVILRDYSGTTHLLDVYTGKRMDKRKVFASDYMRLNDIMQIRRKPHTTTSGGGRPSGAGGPRGTNDPSPANSAMDSGSPVPPDQAHTSSETTESESGTLPVLAVPRSPHQAPAAPVAGIRALLPLPVGPTGAAAGAGVAGVQGLLPSGMAGAGPVAATGGGGGQRLEQNGRGPMSVNGDPMSHLINQLISQNGQQPSSHNGQLIQNNGLAHASQHQPTSFHSQLLLQSLGMPRENGGNSQSTLMPTGTAAATSGVTSSGATGGMPLSLSQLGHAPSTSQMFLDSATLDVNMLLDSMGIQGNQHTGMLDSMLLNTDEQEIAAALLSD